MKNLYDLPCNIAQTLNVIGDKWTLLIMRQIMAGHDTYSEIQANLKGIPSNLLSDRLKSLEADALLTVELYQQHPPRYRYLPTESGEDLADVFNSIIQWGHKHLKKCNKKLIHTSCGGKVEIRYYCPDCKKEINRNELGLFEET